MAMLGNSEDNTALSRALSQLAELEEKKEQLHQEQVASDFFIFEELLADYIRLLGAVRVSSQLQSGLIQFAGGLSKDSLEATMLWKVKTEQCLKAGSKTNT